MINDDDIFAYYDPTINYHKFTLGDLLAIILLATAILPLMYWYAWYGKHRKRIQLQLEKNKQSIAPSELQILQKIEIKPLSDIDIKQEEHATMEVMDYKYDDKEQENDEVDMKRHNSGKFRKGSPHFTTFVITSVTMVLAGSSTDFLGKLIYQMHPTNGLYGIRKLNGLHAIKHEYWLTFALTAGSFFVCMFALCSKSSLPSFKKLDAKLYCKIAIISIMDTIITGGRYLGLIFLSAALICILKNGSQLLFLVLLRRCLYGKKLLCEEWFGVIVIIFGLLVVIANKIFIVTDDNNTDLTINDSIIVIVIMISFGFAGGIRNHIQELLLQNNDLDSNFLLGLESAISLTFTTFIGVLLFVIDPFNNIDIDEKNMFTNIYGVVLMMPAVVIIFVLFLIVIYGKDTMQM
eukprot:97112_1